MTKFQLLTNFAAWQAFTTSRLLSIFVIALLTFRASAEIQNGNFETGVFSPWTVVNGNGAWGNAPTNGSSGGAAGWQGTYYAQSAGSGSWNENTIGTLRSAVFTYPADGKIYYRHGGWSKVDWGAGTDWNYVALKLTNGTELARVYTSGALIMSGTSISSVAAYGKECYLEAIDNRAGSWGWFVVDDFRIFVSGENFDFELGTWEDWTVTGTAFGAAPASSNSGHGNISGWHGDFYANSWIGTESATGILKSTNFVFTGVLEFLIGGHSRGQDGTRTLTNYVALYRDSDDTEIGRVEAPRNDAMSSAAIIDFSATNELVYIKIIDNDDESQGAGWAWICADYFRVMAMEPANFKPIKFVGGSDDISYIFGKPFYLLPEKQSAFTQYTDVEIPCGISAKKIHLVGMVNSVDRGQPVWSPPNIYNRFFIGDTLGTITIKYENSTEDNVPLILGYTAWWYYGAHNSEPFLSDPEKQTLEDTLYVKYTGQPNGYANFLVLQPRTNIIEKIILKNNKSKEGFPMLTGLSFEALDDETNTGGFPVVGVSSTETGTWLSAHSVTTETFYADFDDSQLDSLRETIYTRDEDFDDLIPYTIPENFKGAKINFSGSVTAEVITRIYYATTQDMDDKIDTNGLFHTSTKNATLFGAYEGFGYWVLNYGAYYNDAWSRDAGRLLMEIGELGYNTQMWESCDWFNDILMWYPAQYPGTNINGHPLPGHWVRNARKPGKQEQTPMPTGFGNLENDGHGLIMMAQYKGWIAAGKTADYVQNSWTNFNEAAEYICWLFDNPSISHAESNRLYSDSEGARNHFSLYCDFPCWLGMICYAEMADAIGETAKATRWRQYAAKLEDGINNFYPKNDATYGDIWNTDMAGGWAYKHSALAPVFLWADVHDLDLSTMPADWFARSTNTYNLQLTRCVPEYASGVAMGYGHGYITQSALLLDRMKDASGMIQWLAKLTYFNGQEPYIVPEACEVDENAKWWHRSTDLGNAVQEAENIKSIRLLVGVEDLNPDKLRILPRLPAGFTNMNVENYLITSKSDGQIKQIFADINFSRLWNEDIFKISASDKFDSLSVRLGPYENSVTQILVEVNSETPIITNTFVSGDSRWIWIEGLNSTNEYEITIQTVIPEPCLFIIYYLLFIIYSRKFIPKH